MRPARGRPLPLKQDPAERARVADVAAGRAPADAVLRGATLVDVHMRSLRRADVALAGERIAAVGAVDHCVGPATEIHDCSGMYVMPGFIDPHLHLGFSQVTVERLAEMLVPLGTVAVSSCLAEAAAIVGRDGVEEQLDRAEGTGLDLLLSIFAACAYGPSDLSEEDLAALVAHPRCVELREWSDRLNHGGSPAVRAAWEEAVRRGRAIAGHLEGQSGAELQASAALGVLNDHETVTVEEAIERAQLGITVQMRQGSGARDMLRLLPAVTEHGAHPDMFSFCSDEQELSDLAVNGHIDGKLRLAVANGLAPIEAVRMATINAARSMGIDRDYGAVTPGKLASLAVVENLNDFRVVMTFSRGRLMARDGRYLGEIRTEPYPARWSDTMHVARALTSDDFKLDLPDGRHTVRVIGSTEAVIKTRELTETVEVAAGRLVGAPGIAKLAMADRHEASGRVAVSLIAGLGIEHGALAATVNAGAFNLMVVGVDEQAMALAANRAVELRGGIVVARDGKIHAELALPLLGIVSHEPLEQTIEAARAIAAATRDVLGSPYEQLVPCVGFACLPAIGELGMTDRGIVRVSAAGRELVPLAVGDAAVA